MMDTKKKLLDEILNCSDLEWKKMGMVASIGTGRSNRQDEDVNGEFPFYVRSEKILRSNIFQFDEVAIIVPGEGGIGDIFHYVEGKYALHQRAYRIHVTDKKLLPRFLYYYMRSAFKNYILMRSVGATSISIRKPMLEQFLIPIPSIVIQQKIVDILDTFTRLTAELTAELTARKQQYEYYRDELLTFDEDEVEWRTLEEIAEFRRGSFPQPYGNAQWYDGDDAMPFVQVADIDSNMKLVNDTNRKISKLAQTKSVFVSEGSVIVSLQGSIGRVAITQYDCYVDRTVGVFLSYNIPVSVKYFAYQLERIFAFKSKNARGSTIKTITKKEFSDFKIPVPSLDEQTRIVEVLDKFDALTNSITEGLPREIELRQQQYEYYRDLLLSFPKPDEVK